jgi:hypothetical protein
MLFSSQYKITFQDSWQELVKEPEDSQHAEEVSAGQCPCTYMSLQYTEFFPVMQTTAQITYIA